MGSSSLLAASAIAIVGSIVANVVVYLIAKAVLNISPDFPPLANPGAPAIFTLVGVGLGCAVSLMRRGGGDVNARFTRVALIALAVSMLPDLGLLASGAPGATITAIAVLMLMHVVAAAITIPVLTRTAP